MAAKQLGSEAAKFFNVRESVKLFSLTKRKLFTLAQRTLPNKTIDNCFMRGESGCFNQFDYNHEREVNLINPDRATECAMTDVGEDLLKIACHSEDNNILSPKNLLKVLQEDLSLNAQDDVRDFLTNENYLQPKQPSCLATLSPAAFPETNHSPLTTHNSPKRKVAFTLAEVLITLGIIGVVAAITMPVLLSNVQDRVKQKRVENIKQKLSKVTDKMAVQSGLIGYGDTMSFVQEMSKHMKLAKICDNNHISDCWPTEEVILNDEGKTWEISKTKNAKTLKIDKDKQNSWADTVGIVTADGVPMILSYKKDCDFNVDESGLKFNNSSAMSNSMGCLSGVFDWNGGKNPNKLAKITGNTKGDILPFGAAQGLGTECTIQLGNKCFTAPKPVEKPLAYEQCMAQKDDLGINNCCSKSFCVNAEDYWGGAVAMCGGTDKMITMAELGQLATILYGGKMIGAYEDIYDDGRILDTSIATAMGFLGDNFSVWSGEEISWGSVNGRNFYSSESYGGNFSRGSSNWLVICSGD